MSYRKQVKEEKERLKKELENLEENVLKDFENQRAKLLEIWVLDFLLFLLYIIICLF